MDNTPRKSRLLLRSSSIWYGGTHGDGPFRLRSSDPNAYITKICLHDASERMIGSLQVHFSNGEISQRVGGQNIEQICYSPPDNQCITKVYVKWCLGYWRDDLQEVFHFVNALQFESSDGSTSQLWGYLGPLCRLWPTDGNGGCLKSITVKAGTLIDAAQFYWF